VVGRDNPFVRRIEWPAPPLRVRSAAGTNSAFVSALLEHLPTPGLEINKLFRRVRDDVLAATERKQEPFVYGSLPGEDFFFVAAK
jgi:uncharacterized caspase-like protein